MAEGDIQVGKHPYLPRHQKRTAEEIGEKQRKNQNKTICQVIVHYLIVSLQKGNSGNHSRNSQTKYKDFPIQIPYKRAKRLPDPNLIGSI